MVVETTSFTDTHCQGTIVPETRASNYCNPGELLRSCGTRVYGDVSELTRALTHPLGSAYRTGYCAILYTLCSLAPKVPMSDLYNLVNRHVIYNICCRRNETGDLSHRLGWNVGSYIVIRIITNTLHIDFDNRDAISARLPTFIIYSLS